MKGKPGKTVSSKKKMSRFASLRRKGRIMQNRLEYKTFPDIVMHYGIEIPPLQK